MVRLKYKSTPDGKKLETDVMIVNGELVKVVIYPSRCFFRITSPDGFLRTYEKGYAGSVAAVKRLARKSLKEMNAPLVDEARQPRS